MKRTKSWLLLICLLAAIPARAQKAGTIVAIAPRAIIQRETAAGDLQADKGTDVYWGDLVSTDQDGRLRIVLLDQSIISLGRESEMRVLRQPVQLKQSQLHLSYGKIRVRLLKLPPGQTVELRTQTAVAGVIGTDFGADASIPGTTRFICLEGEVRISSTEKAIRSSVVCKAGEMVDVRAGEPPTQPVPAGEERLDNWRRVNEP